MESVCRACLSPDRSLQLFDDYCIVNYKLLTSLTVEINDGLPQNICSDCLSIMQAFITFRENCIKSENNLRTQILNESVKLENVEKDLLNTSLLDFKVKLELSDTASNYDDDDNYEFYVDIKPDINTEEHTSSTQIDENTKNKECNKKKEPYRIKNEIVKSNNVSETSYKKTKDKKVKKEATTEKKNNSHKLRLMKKFDCGLCEEVFKKRELLIDHLNGHKSSLVCLTCKKDDFISWQALIAHRLNHVGTYQKYCHLCPKKFTLEQSIHHHYLYCHSEKKVKEFECILCNKVFVTIRKLDSHIGAKHSGNTFICDICQRVFAQKHVLGKHIDTHYEGHYSCNICNKNYKTAFSLMNHKLRDHGSGEKIRCEKCHRYFPDQAKKNLHKCTIKNVICQVCGVEVTNKHLSEHMRNHSNIIYECPLCPTKFKSKSGYKAHVDKHAGKPSYKCKYCSKGFYSATTLTNHRRIHTGEKPYVCQFCGKGFPKNHNLKVHMKVHGLNLVQKKNAVDELPKAADID